ncbi:hypothetical protein QF026_003922 [Streptomyces aurantiacus]|uniref:hypothetical protein n=1 Tax=Streptomyces aurantiacus TaxID=47760 RepID=UPI002794B913|nr:hypothetical protein [Streptomyces aurantiacus]
MLRHAIAPVRRYTKASHDVVRHSRLNSDAKVLLLYVQGLPEATVPKPLSEHAARLGMKPRAYQKAKQLLADCGYFHEWREQGARGRWVTEQILANVTLTREEATRPRHRGAPASALLVCLRDSEARPVDAGHRALPPTVVVELLADEDRQVAEAAAANPSLPSAVMRDLTCCRT